jgi:hypothetical protein
MVLTGYSGARGTLIYEKNLKSKISCQTPFEAEVPGWADQMGYEKQSLYHPLGIQESPVYQNHKPYSP